MPAFAYEAVDASGRRVRGELEAGSRAEAYQRLDRERLQPIRLHQKGEPAPGAGKGSSRGDTGGDAPAEPRRLSRAQLILFTDELSDLLEAGLQLEPALLIMEQREELSALKTITGELRRRVREGASFSNALRATSGSFGELYCNLVAAGEASGALAKILRRQADYLTAIDDLQSRVVGALIYPAFIMGAGVVVMFIFMTYLVPQLTVLFEKTRGKLPLMTRMMVSVGDFMEAYWWVVLGAGAAVVFGFRHAVKAGPGKLWWDRVKLRLPLIGPVLASRFYTEFSQTLATLVINGIPLLNGIRLMNRMTANVYLRGLMERVADLVGEGGSFSRALKRVGHFPPLFTDMIAVGEQTGDLGFALEKVGRRYEKELDRKIQRLTALIQPAMIVFMALIVGVVAISMLMGIFESMAGLRTRR